MQDVALTKTVGLNLGGKLMKFRAECFIDICVELLKKSSPCYMPGRELEKLARELEEKKHQQELERLREEEEVKKKSKRYKRDGGKEKEEAVGKKGQQGGKQVSLKGSPAQLLHRC